MKITIRPSFFDNLNPEIKGRLLTVDEVSKILAVKPRTVRSWVYINKIPSIKVGGARRFDPHSLKKWVEEN